MKNTVCICGFFVIQFILSQAVFGQSQSRSIEASRIENDSEIQIDGILNERVWEHTQMASEFTQMQPNDGSSASQRTEVRVLYSGKYLYVGITAFDSAPDSITTSLFRRDGSETSDWVYVNIDSYNDNRT
ncbi:MAG: hypothetical protein MI700_13225, partial [Balneolales bacterium]|nr:hypothetical protein [Balneolales bacterium]